MDDDTEGFSKQERKALREIARAQIKQWPTRRQALGAAGAAAAMGFGAGSVAGQADTGNSHGNVGTPSNPVDLFANGVEFQDASEDPSEAGEMNRNGSDVKVFSGGGVKNLTNIGGGGSTTEDPFDEWGAVNFYGVGPDSAIDAWSKDPNNPVLTPGSGWESSGVISGCLLLIDGTYYMLYTGRPNWEIGLVTSSDLVNWSRDASNPVFTTGSGWESNRVVNSSVTKVGNIYHMLYSGYDGSTYQIGHATASDLVNWSRDASNPVVTTGAGGSWDESDVSYPGIIRLGQTYHLMYAGRNSTGTWQIGHATSTDLSNWTKDTNNPVYTPGSDWESDNVAGPRILLNDGVYHMLYHGRDSTGQHQIGHATSEDLINWERNPNNPVIAVGSSGAWDDAHVDRVSIVRNGDAYEAVYAGQDGSTYQIGHASLSIMLSS